MGLYSLGEILYERLIMKKLTLEDIEPYENQDLEVEELAEKLAKEHDISVEEAELQIRDLMERNSGVRNSGQS